MTKDYYKVLGVARNAAKDEIKKAYRKLAHQYHPDKGGDEQKFKEINEAYHILSDDRKRSQYDQFGQVFEGAPGGQGGFEWPGGFRFDFGGGGPFDFAQGRDFDFTDIFEDFLGGMGGGTRSKARERRGRDIRFELEVTFEEAILGCKKEMEYGRTSRCSRCAGSGGEPGAKMRDCTACLGRGNVQKTQRTFLGSFTQVTTCSVCRGTGKRPETTCARCGGKGIEDTMERLEIFVPRGIHDGEVLKISGKGEASFYGGVPGDLYVEIRVRPHKIFRRQGDDIIMRLPVKLSQAILGDSVEVQTLDGTLRVKIPEGAQPGDILKIRGKGAFLSSGYGRGSLLIEIQMEIPRKAGKKVKEIAEGLKEEGF